MPELPEVEVLVRHLARVLPGLTVTELSVGRPRVIRPTTERRLATALRGARFTNVSRRAKYLVLDYDREGVAGQLLLHLGMTGRCYVQAPDQPLPRHAAVVMALAPGNRRCVFEDPRGFGRVTLDARLLDGLGPEPLGPEFTSAVLRQAFAGSRQAVKVRLMDQGVVAGVGNIYASEALHRAAISPLRRAGALNLRQVNAVRESVVSVLQEAVDLGSTLPLAFEDGADGLFYYGRGDGAPAGVEERFQVYDRAGEPCLRPGCGGTIRRVTQAQRSTFYCPRCQR